GEAVPLEKAFWIFLIVGTVGALFGSASMPLCAVWRWSTGSAIATSTVAAAVAAIAGWRRAGVRIDFHNRFSPLERRSRPRKGILPRSTLSPSLESSAGSTVKEPSIAMPTTMIVAIPKPREVLSPERSIPAMAIITVKPEIRIERPEELAAAYIAARK